MKKQYKIKNKLIKWFTLFVILAFLLTLIGSGIIAFIGNNVTDKKNITEGDNTQLITGGILDHIGK